MKKIVKETPQMQIEKYASQIARELVTWNHYRVYGGQDPFYSDGENMNLTRQHVISYKNDIRNLCAENNIALPTEYYLPTPPKVNNDYLAKNNRYFKKRKNNIEDFGGKVTTKVPTAYDMKLLEIF